MRHRLALALTTVSLVSGLSALAARAADGDDAKGGIVPADAKLELLFTRTAKINGGLTEGAAVAPDGSIYFSDIPVGPDKGQILRFDPGAGKITTFTADSGKANGLMFDAQGRLVACEGSDHGGRCVSRWDVKTGKKEILAEAYMGKRFNAPNDLAIDLKGRIYFTDPRYLGDEPRELEHRAVYRIETEGGVTEVTHDVEKPNGIAISADQKTLYVADNNNGTDRIDPAAPPPEKGAMKIYAFPLDAKGLVGGERKTIYDFGAEAGCDGMTLDSQGNLYLSSRSAKRPGVLVIDPTATDAKAKEVAFIATGKPQPDGKPPTGLPSNVDFGIGADSNMLYITVDLSLYRIRLNAEGYHIPFKRAE